MTFRSFLFALFLASFAVAGETETESAAAPNPKVALGELHTKKQLLNRKNYPKLRRIHADLFEKEHADTLRSAWGEPSEEFGRWLEKNSVIKEEFYLAVEPGKDDLPAAFALFKGLWQKDPKKVEEYPALAIAIAVVWDQKSGVPGDCRRQFGATEPENPTDAMANFSYYSSLEKYFGNRIKLFPYEFLTHLVCHNTTLGERKWAFENYFKKREKLGHAYHDVKWLTNSEIKDKPYTLENQLRYGGVCTCRADFAVQLCRSLAVPAFTGGAGWPKYAGGHSWVIWLEIKNLSPSRIEFTVENCGRYNSSSHIYHTAGTPNPQYRVDWMTDRMTVDLLSRVGRDVMAYRQAKVVMKLYPRLLENDDFTTLKQLELLGQIDDFSPRCEEAWLTMAAAVKDRKLDKKEEEALLKQLSKLVNVFAKHPDFTPWVVTDLLSSPSMVRHREKFHDRLFAMLEAAKRTDLIFEARRNYAKMLVTEDKTSQAIVQLGQSTIKYAIEANRIEPMLNDIEEIAGSDEKRQALTAKFYQQFLNKIIELEPKIPKKYSRDMFNRGADYFSLVGDTKRAEAARMLAAKVVGEDPEGEQPPKS